MAEPRWEDVLVEELARALTYPETPDLRAGVAARLDGTQPEHPRSLNWAFAAVAFALVVAAVVVSVSHDAREAIAGFLGLAVEGERIDILPTPAPGRTATPFPTPAPLESFAQPISRTEAEARIPLVLPSSLGEPVKFYALSENLPVTIADYGSVQVWLGVYFADEYFAAKGIVGGGTVVENVQVNGRPGYWVSGGERIVSILRADGTPVSGTQRTLTANALIWVEDRIYRRIEGAETVEQALALAAEMRN